MLARLVPILVGLLLALVLASVTATRSYDFPGKQPPSPSSPLPVVSSPCALLIPLSPAQIGYELWLPGGNLQNGVCLCLLLRLCLCLSLCRSLCLCLCLILYLCLCLRLVLRAQLHQQAGMTRLWTAQQPCPQVWVRRGSGA